MSTQQDYGDDEAIELIVSQEKLMGQRPRVAVATVLGVTLTRRLAEGLLLLLIVNVCWVGSSELTQVRTV